MTEKDYSECFWQCFGSKQLYNINVDHCGRNFIVCDMTVAGMSTDVSGDSTPYADISAWKFRSRRPFGFSRANLLIEHATIHRASGGILSGRTDTGDLYGNIALRNIIVRGNTGDLNVFTDTKAGDFDYASEVKSPCLLLFENICLENPGSLNFFQTGGGFDGGSYGPVIIRESGPIGYVYSSSRRLEIRNSMLYGSRLELLCGAELILRGNRIYGSLTSSARKAGFQRLAWTFICTPEWNIERWHSVN